MHNNQPELSMSRLPRAMTKNMNSTSILFFEKLIYWVSQNRVKEVNKWFFEPENMTIDWDVEQITKLPNCHLFHFLTIKMHIYMVIS